MYGGLSPLLLLGCSMLKIALPVVVVAVEDSLTWMEESSVDSDRTIILTDSLSLVSKLQRRSIKKTWFPKLRYIKGHTEIVYIPGYAGNRYNERADRLAGGAVSFGNLDMTAADVFGDLRRGRPSRRQSWWTHLVYGENKRERRAARRRSTVITTRKSTPHIATQLMTGTM
jgi:hypothetical protein